MCKQHITCGQGGKVSGHSRQKASQRTLTPRRGRGRPRSSLNSRARSWEHRAGWAPVPHPHSCCIVPALRFQATKQRAGQTAPHPIGTHTHLYCDWSLPPTSGDLSFCSKIRIILMKRTKLTCKERDRTSGQDPLPARWCGSSKRQSSRHCRSKRPGPARPGSAPGRSRTMCVGHVTYPLTPGCGHE